MDMQQKMIMQKLYDYVKSMYVDIESKVLKGIKLPHISPDIVIIDGTARGRYHWDSLSLKKELGI